MKVMVAGGVFRHSAEELARRQAAPEIVLAEGLRSRGVEVYTSPLEDWPRIAVSRGCDVVHVHHLSKAALAVALSPRSKPFVFTEHATGRSRFRTRRVAQRTVLSRASAVVCLSEAEASEKQAAYRLPTSKVNVIRNGIAPPPGTGQPPVRETDGRMVLLYVGQLTPWKQVHRAIEALASLPDRFVLRLVYHNDEALEDLRARTRALGVTDRVTFVGQLAGAALAEEYRRAHLLLLPSGSTEALPSVVTEALLQGLPVVASAIGGVPEQIADAGILVSPDAGESLIPAITAVAEDYHTYAQRALARGAAVAEEYTVDRMISQHLALYESLSR
ncbi:glycosyltransferase family 4 protein [Actinoplanes sp. NPDC024001]|uniref:glycosyltransferase family 4 protein n=1 Tax=Actinoplanes sp. NPDC024001 TaxID=3154598 RepID=UPI0033C4E4A3